jgi:hypothetical protein
MNTSAHKNEQNHHQEGKNHDGSHSSAPPHHIDIEDDNNDYEYKYMDVEVNEYDDRGDAPAMQYIYDLEIRIHMLIVHGMLPLLGYITLKMMIMS